MYGKFLLGTFFSDNKLDIVDQKHVIVSVFFTEFRGGNVVLITDGVDQLIGEFLRGHIEDLGAGIIF